MHSYTGHSGRAITNWIASTDGVKNRQEKESWVVDTFHEVGQEGHTLKGFFVFNAGFKILKKLAHEVLVPCLSSWIFSSRLCHSMGADMRAAMWVEEEAR